MDWIDLFPRDAVANTIERIQLEKERDLTRRSFKTTVEAMNTKIFSVFQQQTPNEQHKVVFTESEVTIGHLRSSLEDWPELERVRGMSKNHFDMAKFETITEQAFIDLCSWLKDILGI